MVYQVACELGQFPDEVRERLTVDDLFEFGAFLKLRNEAEERAMEEARAKARTRR